MGCLHLGHLSLVEKSKQLADYQVMSIFVNKIQFNDSNDYSSYPRTLEKDLQLAEETGVDLVFLPDEAEMYSNSLTRVIVDKLTANLCGAFREGHFTGVFTVVAKLFNLVQPDYAIFGQKDIQQVIGVEKMVFDLNFPVKVIIHPIVREKDGLAMSSRNKHLGARDRKKALVLYKSLKKAENMIIAGEKSAEAVISKMKEIVKSGHPDKIDYISVAKGEDLSLTTEIKNKTIIALAVFWGSTRLIDNMIIGEFDQNLKCIY